MSYWSLKGFKGIVGKEEREKRREKIGREIRKRSIFSLELIPSTVVGLKCGTI